MSPRRKRWIAVFVLQVFAAFVGRMTWEAWKSLIEESE